MTMLEKLVLILSGGKRRSTEKLVQEFSHRFSGTIHVTTREHSYRIEKRRIE